MRYPLVIAVLLLCPLVLFAQTSTPATVFHSNGAFAQFLTITPDGLEIIVQVQRGTDSSGNASTFLIYDTFGPVTDGFVDTFASGVIPDSAFQGGDPAHLSLNVDTSQLTAFPAPRVPFPISTSALPAAPVADTASALATGSFLGVTINSASGQAGVNHNSTLQIVKLQ